MHQRLSPAHKKGDDARNDDPKNTDDDSHPIAGDLSFKQILQVVTVGVIGIVEDVDAYIELELIRPVALSSLIAERSSFYLELDHWMPSHERLAASQGQVLNYVDYLIHRKLFVFHNLL